MKRFFYVILSAYIGCGLYPMLASPYAMAAGGGEEAAETAVQNDNGALERDTSPRIIKMTTQVNVDVQERDGFTRVVLSPNMTVPMEISESPENKGELTITMNSDGVLDMEGLRRKGMKNIYDMQIYSPLDENVQLKVMVPESARYRFFTIQRRGILDVFTPKDKAELEDAVFEEKRQALQEQLNELKQSAQPEKSEQAAADAPQQTSSSAGDRGLGLQTSENRNRNKPAPLRETQAMQKKAEAKAPLPENADFEGSTITLSSTEPFGLAAFTRLGYLWIVSDQEDMRIPPVVEGPNAKDIGEAEEIPVAGGTAYRFALPDNIYIKPEGERFIWTLKLAGRPFALPSASIRKDYQKNGASQLIMTMQKSKTLMRVSDPLVGDDFAVVTVPDASLRVYKSASFVDLDILPAYVGAVLVPKSDGIRIEATTERIAISRRDGLNIGPAILAYNNTSPTQQKTVSALPEEGYEQGQTSLFNFEKWLNYNPDNFQGDIQMRRLAMSNAGENNRRKLYTDTAEFLVALSMPQEALGYLDLIEGLIREAGLDTARLPEYRALNAVALVGSGRYEEALEELDVPVLQNMAETGFWRAMALAGLERYTEAYDALPSNLNFLKTYPDRMRNKLLMDLAELALENEDSDLLQALTNQLQLREETLTPPQKAGLDFYRGRLAMMNGLPGDVKIMLNRAIESGDPYYGTRAGLAFVKEELRNDEITPEQALPRLERLRYAWRGDAIEAEINRVLGETYVYNGELQKGLNILREASAMMDDKAAREKLSTTMVSAFSNIYLDEQRSANLKPLEALAVYDEFKELLPSGNDGDKIVMKIVDKLASVELFSRGISMIEDRMDGSLPQAKKPLWAMKGAALALRNRQAQRAMDILAKVPEGRYFANPDIAKRYNMIYAKAQADQNLIDEALTTLDNMDSDDMDVLKLTADTAWKGQQWGTAADAMSAILQRQGMPTDGSVSAEQAQMILNTAIAYNLAGNDSALRRVRAAYAGIMRGSPLFKSFQVVTRPMRDAVLADRETVMSHVFEADMFDASLEALSDFNVNDTALDGADTDG